MKIVLLFILQLFVLDSLNAQTGTPAIPAADIKDTTFAHVEMESTFPGGVPGWGRARIKTALPRAVQLPLTAP